MTGTTNLQDLMVAEAEARALMHVAFGLAHDVSEMSLNLEASEEMHRHAFHGSQIADLGVSTLANIASASSTLAPSLHSRIEAAHSVSDARTSLHALSRMLDSVVSHHFVNEDSLAQLRAKMTQAGAVFTALDTELLSSGFGMRHLA